MTDVSIVAASTSQQTMITSNTSRKGLTIFNQSSSTLYVSSVNGFTKSNAPIVIGPQSSWVLPVAYSGAFYGVWDTATGQALVTQV